MLKSLRFAFVTLAVAVLTGASGAACGSSGPISTFTDPVTSVDAGVPVDATVPTDDAPSFGGDGALGDVVTGDALQAFDVQPSAQQTITVTAGQSTPVVTFTATANGHAVNVGWSVDRGDLGAVPGGPSSMCTFTPTGTTGGVVTVTAGWNMQTIKRQVLIKVVAQQNGATAGESGQVATMVPQLTVGGGVGGVGGEGLGGPADAATMTALQSPSGDGKAQALTYLYPYDKTVWPRGLLAPLLMWDWSLGDADAIQIKLTTTTGAFSWTGTFGRPAILQQTNGKFVRHPIPQDIWDMATNSAGGKDQITVSLTVARGGKAYGPINETWTIAPRRLAGIIYYNSYGTQLAQNSGGAIGGNGMFGGAVLSIHVGDTGPKLVAGATGDATACRVCHSVAAGGSRLVVQHGESYGTTSAYDLTAGGASVEHVLANGATFPAVYPDGSLVLSPSGQLLPLPNDTTPLPVSGLSTVATNLGTPAFAPDGKSVAFNPMSGPGVQNPTQKLGVMSFNAASGAFSNFITVVDDTGKPATSRPGWPAFLPDGKSLVFHHQSMAGLDGNGDGAMYTRKGAKSQIDWTGATAANVTALDQLNGKGYLPKLATPNPTQCSADGNPVGNLDADHGDDVNLNYEPTVNPLGSGGYAWVVFTSRRMYGNEATIPPFCSDPRGVDLISNITPKKLWVAAIDLGAPLGADPSHPAFYLPAQELLAGNSRAFWVLDPCRPDGTSCQTGDQCCNGYCEANGDGGALVCSNTIPSAQCAKLDEKCKSAADCCDATAACIGGFCTQGVPR